MPVADEASARLSDVVVFMRCVPLLIMIRNVALAMVTEVFTPAQGRGWQGLRKRDASVNSIIAKKGGAPGGQRRRRCWAAEQKRVAHCDGDSRRRDACHTTPSGAG